MWLGVVVSHRSGCNVLQPVSGGGGAKSSRWQLDHVHRESCAAQCFSRAPRVRLQGVGLHRESVRVRVQALAVRHSDRS